MGISPYAHIWFQAGRTVKLDENIPDIHAVIKSFEDKFGDILTLKIGRIGGLTKTRQVRKKISHLLFLFNLPFSIGISFKKRAVIRFQCNLVSKSVQ